MEGDSDTGIEMERNMSCIALCTGAHAARREDGKKKKS